MPIPQYFKEIIIWEVHNIEELKIYYIPSLLGSGRMETLFYKCEENQPNALEWLTQYPESEEMMLTRIPIYYP